MASAAFVMALDVKYEVRQCIKCAVPIAISLDYTNMLRREGGYYWCPYCGSQQGWAKGQSEEDRLKQELKRAEQRAADERTWRKRAEDSLEAERRSKAAYKGQLTKTRKRIGQGVCPCCNESFPMLAEHMRAVHPEFENSESAETDAPVTVFQAAAFDEWPAKIKSAREAAGMSQVEVGNLIGKHQAQISQWERLVFPIPEGMGEKIVAAIQSTQEAK